MPTIDSDNHSCAMGSMIYRATTMNPIPTSQSSGCSIRGLLGSPKDHAAARQRRCFAADLLLAATVRALPLDHPAMPDLATSARYCHASATPLPCSAQPMPKVGKNWATNKCYACQLQHLFDATPEPSLLQVINVFGGSKCLNMSQVSCSTKNSHWYYSLLT